jgi:hypothetical protein
VDGLGEEVEEDGGGVLAGIRLRAASLLFAGPGDGIHIRIEGMPARNSAWATVD